MKEKVRNNDRRKHLQLCLVTILICCTMHVCHSCTPPDAVYAAQMEETVQEQQIVVKGPVFSDPQEAAEPDLTLEQGTDIYHLVSTELTEVVVEGTVTYVSVSIPYDLEGQQTPPETAVIALYDEATESEYERELTYMDMKEKEVLWEKTFSFPITVSGYDSEHFQLGDVLVSKDEELLTYADQILQSMGLSEDYYHINTITWSGEPYEQDGEIFREALAEGEKRIRRVDVTYGGQIKKPDTAGYQYISIYKVPEESNPVKNESETVEMKETMEQAIIFEQNEGFAERIRNFLQEYIMLVTVSSMFILAVLGLVSLWWITKRDTKKQKSKELT